MDKTLINEYWLKFLNNNDNDAFSFIYKESVQNLFSYGIGLGYSPEICKDAIQDIFCKIYIEKKKFQNVQNLVSYLFRSLRNRLIDLTRHDLNINIDDIKDIPFSINVTILDNIINEEDKKNLREKIESLLNTLSNRQREAVYFRYMQDMEYEEIATLMEINVESVRKLIYRGLKSLEKISKILILAILKYLLSIL